MSYARFAIEHCRNAAADNIPDAGVGQRSANNSIRSASGTRENIPDFGRHAMVRPILMLAFDKRRLVTAHGPIKLMCGAPTLVRRHPSQNGDLIGPGLFVWQHAWENVTTRSRLASGFVAEASGTRAHLNFVRPALLQHGAESENSTQSQKKCDSCAWSASSAWGVSAFSNPVVSSRQ